MILGVGLFQNLIYFIQIPLAASELFRMHVRRKEEYSFGLLQSNITIPISIIIPAYNEENSIYETVSSALTTRYPIFEVIVANDGSKDKTVETLVEKFDLVESNIFYENRIEHQKIKKIYKSTIYPNLTVIDKENGGRSDALNTAINIVRNPIFCTLDADSFLDPTALLESVSPFIFHPNEMIATGGTIKASNGITIKDGGVEKFALSNKLIVLFQSVEYIRAFLMGRLAWSKLNIVTILSGAFSVFKTESAIKVGGFDTDTIGEDFGLVMKMHNYYLNKKEKYKMRFVSEPVCWTEVPESFKILRSQRIRWQQGGLEVIFKNIKMLLNPKYKAIGMIALPIMFIIDVIGPILEVIGYLLFPIFYLLGALNVNFMIAFLCLFFLFGVFISTMSLVLEEASLSRTSSIKELLILWFVAIIENFGYRQINNIWRIIGWFRFITKKQSWGNMTRIKRNV